MYYEANGWQRAGLQRRALSCIPGSLSSSQRGKCKALPVPCVWKPQRAAGEATRLCPFFASGSTTSSQRDRQTATSEAVPAPCIWKPQQADIYSKKLGVLSFVYTPFIPRKTKTTENQIISSKLLFRALEQAGAGQIRIFAKIESLAGVQALPEFLSLVDEVVIARGDLRAAAGGLSGRARSCGILSA